MQKWEYFVWIEGDPHGFNELGAEGWELVSAVRTTRMDGHFKEDVVALYFKRPVPPRLEYEIRESGGERTCVPVYK